MKNGLLVTYSGPQMYTTFLWLVLVHHSLSQDKESRGGQDLVLIPAALDSMT